MTEWGNGFMAGVLFASVIILCLLVVSWVIVESTLFSRDLLKSFKKYRKRVK